MSAFVVVFTYCYVHHRSSPELWLIFQLGLLLFNTTIYLMQETDWQITNIISNLFKSTKLLACLKEKVENCDSPFFFSFGTVIDIGIFTFDLGACCNRGQKVYCLDYIIIVYYCYLGDQD